MRTYLPILALFIASFCVSAVAQPDAGSYLFLPNQEVRVESLPVVVAASKNQPDVMLASIAVALLDPELCCDHKSALADQVDGDASLQEIGKALRGGHRLSDGSSVTIVDRYWPATSISAEEMISALSTHRPLLMDWNGRVYVVSGAIFDEYRSYTGGPNKHAIKKFLLIDTRFSGERRSTTFDRQTEDWSKVKGFLALNVVR